MDILPRITRQLIDRLREMSQVQRATSIAFVLVVGLGFGGLLISNHQTEFRPVSFGKVFGADELASAERALVTAGLTGFQRDGQRLIAPGKDLDRYNAALLEFDALPADLGSQMLKQYESLGPFSTDRQRQQMKEALLLQELRRMIKAVPDIEEARVAIASPDRKTGWNQKPRTTANVTITPRAGRDISTTLVNSLRHVVASMVPDLQPADVTIFDVKRGQVYTGEASDDSSESRYLCRAREFTQQYEQQIQKALLHIPRVSVVVQVDLDAFTASIVRSESIRSRSEISPVANRPAAIDDPENHLTGFRGPTEGPTDSTREINEQTLLTALPKAVRVSVTIPRDYLREVASRPHSQGVKPSDRRDLPAIEEDVLAKVERIVGRLIPADSARNSISVTCVDRVDGTSVESLQSPLSSSILDRPYVWVGAIALSALSVLAFLASGMLRRSTSVTPVMIVTSEIEGSAQTQLEIPHTVSPFVTQVAALDRVALLRDEIRTMVRNDPAASTELLGRWLSEAQQ